MLVIGFVLVVQNLLGRRLGARMRHMLWGLVIARLALPWVPASPLGLDNVVPTPGVDMASPESQLASLSDTELRHVVLHELAHLKRRDLPLAFLVAALQAVHWFNPFVSYGFYRVVPAPLPSQRA